MHTSYLIAFIASALCSLVLTRRIRDFAVAHGWAKSAESSRHVHVRPVPRIGGVAIFLSVICVVLSGFFFPRAFGVPIPVDGRVAGILGPASLIFLLGLYDDFVSLRARVKFFVQAIAAVWLYLAGFGVYQMDLLFGTHTLKHVLALPLTIFWVLLITNAFNLIDGLDGLAAGSALFSMAVMFVVALIRNEATVSIMTIVLAGATCGFLRFNFHPATIFLGDSGSLFIGFVLSALALAGSEKATTAIAVAIPVVSFGLPIVDVVLAVVRRLIRGKHLFSGDNDHIHHRLLKKGFSHRDAVILLYAISAGFGLLSLSLLHDQNRIALVLSVVGIGVWSGVRYLRYAEISEVQRIFALVLQQRQILANDLAVRQAAEALESSSDFDGLCRVVRATLEPLGFAGMYFQLYAKNGASNGLFAPLRDDGNGGLWYYWGAEIARTAEWELRLELAHIEEQSLGKVSLFRSSCDEPICIENHLLCSAFRMALTGAVNRALCNVAVRAGEYEVVEIAKAHRAGTV